MSRGKRGARAHPAERPGEAPPAPTIDGALAQAVALHQSGRLDAAEALYRAILQVDAGHFDALHLLGVVRHQQGRHAAAETLIRAALERRPGDAMAHSNLGEVLRALNRQDEAVEHFRTALTIRPDHALALNNLGGALKDLRRHDEAAAAFRQAIAIEPGAADPHANLGKTLNALDLHAEAIESFERALAIRPDHFEALFNKGAALLGLERQAEAAEVFRQAVAIRPDAAEAHALLGFALGGLHRFRDAVDSLERAIALQPDLGDAHESLGHALAGLLRFPDAIASYRRALELKPERADLHHSLALVLSNARRYEEALAANRRTLELDPDHPRAFSSLASCRRRICEWTHFADDRREAMARVREGRSIVHPFDFCTISDDPHDQLLCARTFVADWPAAAPVAVSACPDAGRIRIGYLSADFRNHVVAFLTAELFERHDRERFEVFAFSHGPDDGSPLRRRLEGAFDHFVEIRDFGDADAATAIAAQGIHIVVDLSGHTSYERTHILAHRPAPVQVNYLGYAGTIGADFIDYVLVDPIAAPAALQPCFTERLVHLPDCYVVNDTRREIARAVPSRRDCGLPDEGIVFCCFIGNFKITPDVFDVWMRLLEAVPGSVLWLADDGEAARRNLGREAEARGVAPDRLVFARRLPSPDHLARLRHADLYLDTVPFTAHGNASDALWVGVPLVTCIGRSLAGRGAASMLHAVGMAELVTDSLEAYAALALALTRDPARLATVRARLERSRATTPLFDTARACRAIERAYAEMWARWRRGEPPAPFAVAADPVRT